MTETKRPLFRPEAVEHHMRGRVTGRVLDLREDRTVWVFRGLLVALALALLLSMLVRVSTSATGAAVVEPDGETATVLVRRAPPGAVARVRVEGREVAARVEANDPNVVLRLAEPLPPGAAGSATIDLGDASVLNLVLGWD